jgi:hypothetical protein
MPVIHDKSGKYVNSNETLDYVNRNVVHYVKITEDQSPREINDYDSYSFKQEVSVGEV